MNYVIFNDKFDKNKKYQNIFEVIEEVNGIKIKDLLKQEHDVKLDDDDYYRILYRNLKNEGIYFVKDKEQKIIGEIWLQFCESNLEKSEEFNCDFCINGCYERYVYNDFWKEYYGINDVNSEMECENCEKGTINYYYNNTLDSNEELEWKPLFKQKNYREYEDFKIFEFHSNWLENKE